MTILQIRTVPDPILRRKSRKIRQVDDAIRELAHNMVETMHEAGGVGLAAPQVGELSRLIVLQLPDEEGARILINPEITRRDGEREVEEGCLSVPGFLGTIMRSERVKARAVGEWGA
jgi:peptide deformylase